MQLSAAFEFPESCIPNPASCFYFTAFVRVWPDFGCGLVSAVSIRACAETPHILFYSIF
jgi:hypothetical protein